MLDAVFSTAGLLGGLGASSLPNNSGPSVLGTLLEFRGVSWLKMEVGVLVALVTLAGMIPVALPWALDTYWWVLRFFTASVSIGPKDRLNREVINWLGVHVLERQARRILTARSEMVESDAWLDNATSHPNFTRNDLCPEKYPPIQYLPTFNTTWFFFERHVFIIRRINHTGSCTGLTSTGDASNEWSSTPEGKEPLLVLCLGRSVAPIKRFLESCRVFAERQREAFVTVRVCNTADSWRDILWDTTILRPLRPLNTVHFDQEVKNDLVADIERYLRPETRRFYQGRGIPYRRGYLLHGPAGTGKTSLSYALASLFELELYILDLPSLGSDSELRMLFTQLPSRCFVLVEDIDAVGIRKRRRGSRSSGRRSGGGSGATDEDSESSDAGEIEQSRGRSKVTLSGLLNVLDGVASQEGRIVLMTSNYADQLDAALVRPGRIDRKVFLGNISRNSAEGMFLRWFMRDPTPAADTEADGRSVETGTADAEYNEEVRRLASFFAAELPDETFTPALLQNFLQTTTYDPHQAVSKVTRWVEEELAKMAAMVKHKRSAR